MQVSVLDLLIVIPLNDIIPYGIPYLQNITEDDMTYIIEIYKTHDLEFNAEVEVDRWKQFWAYFNTLWMGKLCLSWNIHDQDDST